MSEDADHTARSAAMSFANVGRVTSFMDKSGNRVSTKCVTGERTTRECGVREDTPGECVGECDTASGKIII